MYRRALVQQLLGRHRPSAAERFIEEATVLGGSSFNLRDETWPALSELPRALCGRVRSLGRSDQVSDSFPVLVVARDTRVCAHKHPTAPDMLARNWDCGAELHARFFPLRPRGLPAVVPYLGANNRWVNSCPVPVPCGRPSPPLPLFLPDIAVSRTRLRPSRTSPPPTQWTFERPASPRPCGPGSSPPRPCDNRPRRSQGTLARLS